MPRSPMPRRMAAGTAGFAADFAGFIAEDRDNGVDVMGVVRDILKRVRAEGDAAVLDYTRKFDRVSLTAETMRVTPAEVDAAFAACDPKQIDALKVAAARIDSFHRRQLPDGFAYTDPEGVELGLRWSAVEAVGLYVPGGLAAYPSSVLMNAMPAKVAGVPRIVMTVPTPDGVLNPLVLAAAKLAGVTEIYRLGGAQAVGALAYGTQTIQPVDKIVGPGNAYVAEAKRQVFGTVGIDSIAGPSEILVVADRDNAQSVLFPDDAGFADAVAAAVERQLAVLPRGAIARQSWEKHGAIITVPALADAVPLVDRIAPEHLELAVADPEALSAKIRNAGAIFLGRHTPEAVGDYVAGPNHVLPTSRTARFSSGLGVLDFMKRSTLIRCDAASLGRIGPAAVTLAEAEGLDAHARSVSIRLGNGAPEV